MPRGRGTVNHTHKYRKLDSGFWGCGDCTHYLPKNVADMIYSRFSKCWECDRIVRMTDPIMDFAEMHNNGRILCDVHIERLKRMLEGEDTVLIEAEKVAKEAAAKLQEQIDKGDIKL
jgi:hypothetical protein